MSQSESFSYMRVWFCLNYVTVRLLVIVPVFSNILFWKRGVVLVTGSSATLAPSIVWTVKSKRLRWAWRGVTLRGNINVFFCRR